nr:hypothetical protein Iba_scaffold2661CG0030 [Ipomoea batatas]
MVDMTSENNCIIEDVDNACVEMPSDEIGVKEHDNFCDEPYDDSFDHNCGDAYIENVVGNVDCVVDNVHANPLENVGNINARRDDDICDNSSNACKNATYDLHDRAFMCGNEFWVTNEVIFLTPCDFNDNDSFDSSDDDENCFDTCENNSFNSIENNSIESCVNNFSNSYDSNSSNPCENKSSVSLEDNDGLESFTFDDNALINENDDKLHEIVCGDDNVHDDVNMCELNDVEFVNFFDDCIDVAMYVHEFLGEVEEEMNGSEGDVLLNSEKERENEKQEIMVEGVENENVKEEVEDKNKTSDESVREEVEEKVRNDEKEFGEKKKNEKRGKLEEKSILMDMDSCKPLEGSMLCIELKEFANTRHVRAYLEERVDGAKGFVPVQVCWNEGLKVASGYGR